MLASTNVGKAGELRVASELLLRGHRPLLAIVDDGVDIHLVGRTTSIQAKTCLIPSKKNGDKTYYVFTMHSPGQRQEDKSRPKKQRMVADFAIFWCVGIDSFFIVPAHAVGTRHTINIPEDSSAASMWNEFNDAWWLLEVDD